MIKRKFSVIAFLMLICTTAAACGIYDQYPVEPLSYEQYTYYGDNLTCFGDDVENSGSSFIYVVLPFNESSGLSADELAAAKDNADGIILMAAGDYHSVLDLQDSLEDPVSAVCDKLGIRANSDVLLIGDAAAEARMLDGLSEHFSGCDYRNSQGVDDSAYDELYELATSGTYDAVIVANDAAAYHAQSFPYSSDI